MQWGLEDVSAEGLEYAAPNHNREWCTCPYCEELRRREKGDVEICDRCGKELV